MQKQLPGQDAGSDIPLETTSKQKKIPLWYLHFWGYLNYDSSIDKKLNDVLKVILKTQDMKARTYKYIGPQDKPAKVVDTDFIKSNLSVINSEFESLQGKLADENYKVVNAHANTYAHLKGADKGLFTKASSDLEALVKLF